MGRSFAAWLLAVSWLGVALGQPIISEPTAYQQWTELVVPSISPVVGKQLVYAKTGVGVCAKDSNGIEFCPGGGGGGSTTVSCATNQGLTCSPNPITTSGSVSIQDCAASQTLRRDSGDTLWQCSDFPAETVQNAFYRFSTTTTMADPGSGKLRFNNATVASATQIAISDITDGGTDITQGLNTLNVGDALYIQDQDNASNFARFSIAAALTDNTSWHQVPVTFTVGGGVAPSNNARIIVQFIIGGSTNSVNCTTGLTCTPNPLTSGGTIALTSPVAIANGGTNGTTQTAGFDNLSPVTTKGDIIVRNASNNVRLGVGADGTCLQADSAQATGLKYGTCGGGGGVTSVDCINAGLACTPDPITATGTVALADDAAALEALSTTGIAARTGTSTWSTRTLVNGGTSSTNAVGITNGDGVSGNPTFILDADLEAIADLTGIGFVGMSGGAGTVYQRAIQAGANISVTNGSGLAGDPTIAFVGPAPTATALAANGGNCSAGLVAAGVDASGAAEGCVDHGGLGGLADDDHTQYLLLAGRSGGQTANGGTAASENLTLSSNSSGGARGFIVANDTIKVLPTDHTIGSADEHGMLMTNAYTQNGSSGFVHAVFQIGSTTYTASPLLAHPNVVIESGINNIGAANIQMFQPYFLANPMINIINSGFTWSMEDDGGTIYDLPNFRRVGTGQFLLDSSTCSAAGTPNGCCSGVGAGTCTSAYTFLRSKFQLSGGATINTRRGFAFNDTIDGAGGGSGTISNQIALQVNDLTRGSVSNQALYSLGSAVYSRHAGPFRIGDTTVPTEKLEVAGNEIVTGTVSPRTVVATNPGSMKAIIFTPSYTSSSGGNASRIIDLSPTVTVGAATTFTEGAVGAAGTYNVTSVPGFANTFTLFQALETVNFQATDTAKTWAHTVFADQSTLTAASNIDANNTAVSPKYYSFRAIPKFRALGSTGNQHLGTAALFSSEGSLETDTSGGTMGVDVLDHYSVTAMTNAGAGTERLGQEVGLEIPDMTFASNTFCTGSGVPLACCTGSGTGTCGSLSLRSAGAAVTMLHAGSATFGSSTLAPAARMHITEPTIGNEELRVEAVATNDDPNLKVFSSRATAAAGATTNIDFNLTTGSVACPASSGCLIEARTTCNCTAGSACTGTTRSWGGVNYMTVTNQAGTITIQGAQTTAFGAGSGITSVTLSVNTPSARAAVVVPANFTEVCHIKWLISSVGT